MAAQDVTTLWKAWCTSQPGSALLIPKSPYGQDAACIDFTYNNGNGVLGPNERHRVGWRGLLFYDVPPIARATGGEGTFFGWGRAQPPPQVFSLTTAATSPVDGALPVRELQLFPPNAPFWIVVQDSGWDETNREIMQVTGGTGAGSGSLVVTRGQLGTAAVAHRGDPNDPSKSSFVGLICPVGDPAADAPLPVDDSLPTAQWLYLAIPLDTAIEATFRFHVSDDFGYPGDIEGEKSVLARDGTAPWGNQSPWNEMGELNYESPWWLTSRQVTAGFSDFWG